MDKKVLKSSAKAAGSMVGVFLLLGLFGGAGFGASPFYAVSAVFSVIIFTWIFLSTPVLGFLSIYFFIKEKGVIRLSSYALLIFASTLLYFLAINSFSLLTLPFEHDASSRIGFILDSLLIYMFPSIIGVNIGAWLATLSLLNKEEKTCRDVRLISQGTALALIVLVAFVLWQFGTSPPHSEYVIIGFPKMQPHTPSIYYRGANFSAAFTNALGTTVKIKSITLNETISGSECASMDDLGGTSVKAGATFTVKASGCHAKADGEAYDMRVNIEYSAKIGGISIDRNDTGHIKGQGEPL